MNLFRFRGVHACLVPHFISGRPPLSTSSVSLHYTCNHLIPCFPPCSCLRLVLVHLSRLSMCTMATEGTVNFVLLPMSHPSAFFFTLSYPHQASIRTSTSNPHISILTAFAYIFPRSLLLPPLVLQLGKDGVLDRLVSVSNFVGSPGWTLHCSPSAFVFQFFLPPILVYLFSLRPSRFVSAPAFPFVTFSV